MRERVLLDVPYDRVRKDQVIVSVNGYHAIMPRGKQYNVPRYAAEVVRESMKADYEMAIRIEEMEKAAKSDKALN